MTDSKNMKPLLIVKTGRATPVISAQRGDFEDWIATAVSSAMVFTVDVANGETLPAPDTVCGAIITGSAAMITDKLPWSERTAAWLRAAHQQELPLLGICYGHQLLAHALGGRVDSHPKGWEVGTAEIVLFEPARDDPLFGGLPVKFSAHFSHRQSVLEPPLGTVRLAGNAFDACQALRFGPNAWGVQFHPEFAADVMQTYLALRMNDLAEQDIDLAALCATVRETPEASSLLKRFADLAFDTRGSARARTTL